MVPKGWERKPIKELCESIIDCVNKTAKHVDYTTPYKMIRTTNVRHGKVDTENVRYVDEDVYKQWIRRGAPQDGDIIFTREAPVGEAGILEDSEGIFLGQRTMMYRVNPEIANNRFVFYSLMSGYCQKQIEDFSNGGTVAHMRVPDCGEIIINAPPLAEQQKIAKILSTWDKAISTTESLIENSTQQKKALMQQLLTGKKRLLDESGKRFEVEWERLKLEDIVIKTQLGTSERTKDVEEESTISLIKMGNLTWGGFSFDKLETLPKSKMDESLILKSGDFLFNTRNTPELVGKSAVWKEQQVEATFDNNINRVTFNRNINTDFMCLYLTYGKGKSLISSLSAGSTSVAAIYWKDLKNIKLPVPTLSEQQKIANVLANVDKEIELLEQQLADLQQEKKALMQVLLTGKKRVKINE